MKLGANYKPVRNHGANLGGRDVTMPRARWVGMANTRDVSAQGYFFCGLQPYGRNLAGLHLNFYSYHMDKPSQWGEKYKIQQKIRLRPNRWYCVERHMKLNSVNPIQADGLEELWVDGELSIRREGLRFRKVPQLKITIFSLETYYHGLPADFPQDNPIKVFFDNVVIARKYIGPTVLHPPKRKNTASFTSLVVKPKPIGPLAAHAEAIAAAEKLARSGDAGGAAAAYGKIIAELGKDHPEAAAKIKLRLDGVAARKTLIQLIVSGLEQRGGKPVYIDFAGQTLRARLVAATADGGTFNIKGSRLPMSWALLAPRRLAGIAAKYATSGREHLPITRFLLACGRSGAAAKSVAKARELGITGGDLKAAKALEAALR